MHPLLCRPATVDEAVRLLAAHPEARLIAGGATLVAMINARLADPERLVSLRDVAEIRGIGVLPDGGLRIGAFTRHRETAGEARLAGTLAVVRAAAGEIANATVRNMGTIGGSIAFADPGLDYPPALVAARARIEIASTAGRRVVAADDFFVDWYATGLAPGEMVTAVELPPPRPGVGVYRKLARVAGDYATASVALSIATIPSGLETRVAVGACGPTPLRSDEADRLLSGRPGEAEIARAGLLLQAAADPVDDVRGSAEYRRLVIPRLLADAMAQALRRLEAGHG